MVKVVPWPVLAPGVNSPAVMVHDEIAGHEVDAVFHRAVAADYERVEYQPQRLLRQPRAVVADLHLDLLLSARAPSSSAADRVTRLPGGRLAISSLSSNSNRR